MDIDTGSTAVLAMHWQNDIVSPKGRFAPTFSDAAERHGVVPRTAELLAAARQAGVPVIYTRVCFRPGYPDLVPNGPLLAGCSEAQALVDGEWGAQIMDEVVPADGDPIVDGRRISGFWGTDLDLLLKARGIDTALLTGVATNFTVLSTGFDLVNTGYRIVAVSDCCSAADDAVHDAAIHTLEVIGGSTTAAEAMAAFAS